MQRLRRYHSGRGERFCITRGAENNQSTLRDLGYWHVCDGRHVLFALYSHEALIAHARDVGVLAAREEVSL